MRVSVVIPTYNRREIVLRAVGTVFAQEFPAADFEVVVVVDGSRDGSAEALRALSAPCAFRVLEQENRGLAGARNTGWREAKGELIVFLDDDMLCDKTWLTEHVAMHVENERRVAVGAILLSDDTRSKLAAATYQQEFARFLTQPTESRFPDAWYLFGNTSLRKKWLEQSGGFDERYRMREDAELSLRLRAMGAEFQLAPKALARQIYTKTTADLLRDAEKFGEADALFLNEHPEAKSFAADLAREPGMKRGLRGMAASMQWLVDAALAPVCWLGEGLTALRPAGVRALQIRRGVRYDRARRRGSGGERR